MTKSILIANNQNQCCVYVRHGVGESALDMITVSIMMIMTALIQGLC